MRNQTRCFIQAFALFLAISFVIFGLLRGEASVVMNKAINICMECIGLG